MSMMAASRSPISAMNFRSERKYQGRIPISMMVAVNMMALPVVVSASVMALPQSPSCVWYSSQIRDSK